MSGYIGLYRCLLEKPIWQNSTPEQKSILITVLLMVNHHKKEWEWKNTKFIANPGQTITSIDKIVKAAGKGITTQNVRSALKRFEKLEFLTNESTKTGRLITIVNWELYQIDLIKHNKDTSKEVTNNQQRDNKEVTPNNNDNKDKNDKKDTKEYSPTSIEYQLSEILFKYIKQNNPKAKEPNFQTWAKTFDLILRVDKREPEEIKKVIAWCQNDNFWFKNILSPEKLRKQYDRLLIQCKNPVQQQAKGNWNNYQQRHYDFNSLEKAFEDKFNKEI